MPLQDLRKAEGTRSTENWWRGGASGKGKQSLLTATWTLSLQTVRSLGAGPWTAELPLGAARALPFLNHRGRGPRSSYQCKVIVIRPRKEAEDRAGAQEGSRGDTEPSVSSTTFLGSGHFLKTPGEGAGVGLLGGQGGSVCFLN